MKIISRILLAATLAFLPIQAWAASGATTVGVLDGGSTSRNVNVFSSTGAITGNLSWMNTVCDYTTLTTCATVDSGHGLTITGEGTAGSAAGGVVTVQGVGSMTPFLVNPGTVATWGIGTAGSPTTNVVTVQGVSGGTAQPVSVASGGIASGAVASGAYASGSVASGAFASGSIASGAIVSGGDVTEGTTADTTVYAGSGGCTVVACLKGIYSGVTGAIPAGTNTIGNVGGTGTSGTPAGGVLTVQGASGMQPLQVAISGNNPGTQLTASATGTTGATTATLTPVGSTSMFICGFSIRANATGAATGNATVTGTITGTLNFTQWTAPLASGIGVTEEIFQPCIIGSSSTQAIAVVSAAPGSGGTVSVTAWGYYQ